jgi:hypothetical protein
MGETVSKMVDIFIKSIEKKIKDSKNVTLEMV